MKHLTDIYEGLLDNDFDAYNIPTLVYELCQNLTSYKGSGKGYQLRVKNMRGFEGALKKLGTEIQNPAKYDFKDLKKDEILLFNLSPGTDKTEAGHFLAVFLNDKGRICNMGFSRHRWDEPNPTFYSEMRSVIWDVYPMYICKHKDEIIQAIQQYWAG